MPLVFVHGVNVREGELYSRERAFRDRHFVEIFYRQLGRQVAIESILNPYWGDLGASLSPDTPFLPRGGYDMLWRRNLEADPDTTVSDIQDIFDSDCATPLLEMARTASLADVVDLLWDIVDQEMNEGGPGREKSAEDMARLAQRALDFAHSPEGDAWLKTVKTDEELLERLGGLLHEDGNQTNPAPAATKSNKTAISGLVKSAGGRFQKRITDARHHLKNRSKSLRVRLREDMANVRLRIRQKAVGTTARLINNPIRAIFHQQCALLIGDAFSYFSARGDDKPSPIAQRVIDALQEAAVIRDKTGEEVIVIGHSMGGVILCDIVTHYGKDIPIDVLITVGSQFPLFADLKMFPGVDPADRPVPRPDNVKRWINIFDPHDFLGYPGSHIFEGIDDFHLPTYAVGGAAHTDYFNRPSFYWQLARRLMDYVPVRA